MIEIKFFNFLTRKIQKFKPLRKGKVFIYACGPTVYDYVHLGNLRTFLFYDFIRRSLEYLGFKVKIITNITDIDDKIIKKANNKKTSWKIISKKYEKSFFEDLEELNIKKASLYPRASEHIKEIIKTISLIEKNGFAYKTKDGVYFNTSKFNNYGRLVDIRKQSKTKSRILADDYEKKEAVDFALWKFKKPNEPYWKSPWGDGRPGWHIECSAMSVKYLKAPFDIHCGGIDLLFPHHENEIAQTKAALNKNLANFFIETEHLMINGQKMSKRFKNFLTLNDLKSKNFLPLAFRYLMLSYSYQKKANFTFKSLSSSQNNLISLWIEFSSLLLNKTEKIENKENNYEKKLKAFLANNLDTPKALSLLNLLIKERGISNKTKAKIILKWDNFFGLGFLNIKRLINGKKEKIKKAKLLIKKREKERKNKNWKQADKIRKNIEKLGFIIEDTPKGTNLKLSELMVVNKYGIK